MGVDDALAADNVCPFVLQVRPQPTYVLMTRQADRPKGHVQPVPRMCAGARRRAEGRKPTTADAVGRPHRSGVDATARPLAAGDLILLDHPGKLSDETIKLLAGLLRRGRPILYVAGELIDATNLKRLCEAAGSGLQMPVEFTPPPAGQVRRDLFLTSVRRDSPPFRVFGDSLTSIIGRLRFAGGLELAAARQRPGRRRAGHLQRRLGRHRAHLVRRRRAGRDQRRSGGVEPAEDLGLRAAAGGIGRTDARSAVARPMRRCAASRWWPICPAEAGAAAGLRVVGPSGAAADADAGRCGELADEARGRGLAWAIAGTAGRLSRRARRRAGVRRGRQHSRRREPTRSAAARRADRAGWPRAARPSITAAVDEGQQRDDFWKWFAVACVVCILGEMSALVGFPMT